VPVDRLELLFRGTGRGTRRLGPTGGVIWFKICPVLLTGSAALLLIASLI
jgi:hypothetical protein